MGERFMANPSSDFSERERKLDEVIGHYLAQGRTPSRLSRRRLC
jgi:hypothetical protein